MAVQTCDQAIIFRNFDYSRALEIVQDEEYLDDVDLMKSDSVANKEKFLNTLTVLKKKLPIILSNHFMKFLKTLKF